MTIPQSELSQKSLFSRFALVVACIALGVMPLAMWLANRSAPLFLGVCALACFVVLWCEKWPLADKLRIYRALRSRATMVMAGFLGFAALSLLWSHKPAASLFSYGELIVPIISAVVVALVLPPRAPRWLAVLLLFSVMLATVLTFIELHYATGFRQSFGMKPMTFIFNRSLIFTLMIVIPLVGWLMMQNRLNFALVIGAMIMIAIITSESGAAKLGFMIAIIAALATVFAPRLSLIAAATVLVALIAFAPVQGEIAERLIPASAHQKLHDSHSKDRVDIWLSFGEAIRARPIRGSGFGTSPTLHEHRVAARVSPERRPMLAVGHPHSTQVQVWTELGLVGASLMLWLGVLLVIGIGQRPRRAIIAPVAALACAVAIAAVGHGAWQAWWIASLGTSIIWFRVFDVWQGQDIKAQKEKRI